MCCNGKLDLTLKFLKKHRDHKTIQVFKALKKDYKIQYKTEIGGNLLQPLEIVYNTFLRSPCQNVTFFRYKVGINKSDSRCGIIRSNREINRGIHVFLTKKSAQSLARSLGNCKVVKMTAKISDLICIGRYGNNIDNAVFREVHLSQKQYNLAMGKRSKIKA